MDIFFGNTGFLGGGYHRCSSIASSEPKVLKFEDEEKLLGNAKDSLSVEEISKIREEYNAAKEKFLKIPDALKQMPKMNPKGCPRFLLSCCSAFNLLSELLLPFEDWIEFRWDNVYY